MLSIGKLTPGRATYYADQLPGGGDEYYTKNETEARAVWLGSAAGALGLAGPVEPGEFRRLLGADHPITGEPLGVPRTTKKRLAGFDLCFSAPKSASVAWALAAPQVAERIAAAHDRAVAQAIDVFESEVVRARRGKHAATLIETDGVVAAAFGHRSSRAGDPQLHTYVVVPNVTVDAHGRWSALAGDRVYRWAKTLGYLYQAALRAELTKTLGFRWGPVGNGVADIAGVPKELCETFSTRRAQITAALEAAGAASPAAAEIAALSTRTVKDTATDLDTLRARWRHQAAELGIHTDAIDALAGPGRTPAEMTGELADHLLAPDGLTEHSSSFDRRHVLQAIAAGHSDGLTARQGVRATDAILARTEIVPLAVERPAGQRYSTVELLAVEADLVSRATARTHDAVAAVDQARLAEAFAEGPNLTAEQKAMVESLVTSGAGVEVVVGRGGAGKTFALDAARAAWQASGVPVIGAALAARAAAELQAGSGIPSTTLDRLLAELERPGPISALPRGSVVVVDEAAMVGTRKLSRLAAAVERAKGKLVLVGDHKQLPEIEAGGAFAALAGKVPTSELAGNRRQIETWEREALSELRSGSVPDAVAAYNQQGRITLAPTAEAAREAMVDDWWAAYRTGDNVAMYALRRADVDDLNQRGRSRLEDAGLLGSERLEAAGRQFAVGDEVMCLRNDRQLAVKNGNRSAVAAIDPAERVVVLADGTRLPSEYLDSGHLGYSYATTVHKSQGSTVDKAFLLGSDALYREAGYVGLSRARQANRLYVVTGERDLVERDGLAETIRQLGRSRSQILATEQLSPISAASERAALLADPPPWLLDTLGPPPVVATERDAWAHRAERLAAYRDIHQIDDTTDALGPRPGDPAQRRAWELAHLAIEEHHRSLELDQGLHL